jgi:hypothetical protein
MTRDSYENTIIFVPRGQQLELGLSACEEAVHFNFHSNTTHSLVARTATPKEC